MTFDPTAPLDYLRTALTGAAPFATGSVTIGEPFGPPPPDLAAALFFVDLGSAREPSFATTLDAWVLCTRIYARAGMTPGDAERVERLLAGAMSTVLATLAAHLTLGDTVALIDWLGEMTGTRVSAKWGHLDVGGTIFRVCDLTIPVLAQASASFSEE